MITLHVLLLGTTTTHTTTGLYARVVFLVVDGEREQLLRVCVLLHREQHVVRNWALIPGAIRTHMFFSAINPTYFLAHFKCVFPLYLLEVQQQRLIGTRLLLNED